MHGSKTIVVTNIPVSYVENSDGVERRVLFLHGWGSNKESFGAVQKNIPGALSIDLPGFGKTPLGDNGWDVQRYAQFVVDFCVKKNIDLDIVDIVGHSFGGRIAVEIASQKLLNTKHITLVGTPIYREVKPSLGVLVRLGRLLKSAPGGRALRSWYYRTYLGVDDYLDAEGTQLAYIFKQVINYEVSTRLDMLHHVVVRLLWGTDDETISQEQATQAAQEYGFEMKEVGQAGHFPFVDQPEEFAKTYRSFGQ